MELGHYHALSTVDHECAVVGHVRNRTEKHVLNHCLEIHVVWVAARKLQLRFQWHTVGQTAFQTLFNGVAWGVDVVVKEVETEVVAGVGYWEILCEHLVQSVVLTLLWRRVQLKEVSE